MTVCLSVECSSSIRYKAEMRLVSAYNGWTAVARRLDDGCKIVVRPFRIRRLSTLLSSSGRNKVYFDLITVARLDDGYLIE